MMRSHQRAKHAPANSADENRERRMNTTIDQTGDQNAGGRHDGADRKIDPAGENDKRGPDRGDAEKSVIAEQVDRHAQRTEIVVP